MLAVLDWIYGPTGLTDPNYLLMRDILMVLPWWYPYMWLVIGAAVISFKKFRVWRRKLQARRAGSRVAARTQRLLMRQAREMAAQRLMRLPANDFPGMPKPTAA